MNPLTGTLSALVLILPIAMATGQTSPSGPAEQYSAILKEYLPVSGGMRVATTDLQRKAAVESLAAFSSKFIELAEKYPSDPVALKAIQQAVQAVVSTDSAALNAWEMNRSDFPAGSTDGAAEQTVALLLRDHILSDQLGPVIDRMRYGYRMNYEHCLQTVLEKNPHRDIQALTCLALAQFLSDKMRTIQLAEDRPELTTCCEIVFGKDYLPELQRLDRTKLAARIEELFERVVNEYGDVRFRGSTVGETAKSELYAIRHLAVGKVAPNIKGKDQDGTQFQLTDYRGKVVLLYFWSEF
jgi:hypothetical protein